MYKCTTELKGDEIGFITTRNKITKKEYGAVFHSGKQFDVYIDTLTEDYEIVTSFIKYDRDNYGEEKHDLIMSSLGRDY